MSQSTVAAWPPFVVTNTFHSTKQQQFDCLLPYVTINCFNFHTQNNSKKTNIEFNTKHNTLTNSCSSNGIALSHTHVANMQTTDDFVCGDWNIPSYE